MSLVTPDTGLLIWMTLIFGIVFFLLAKFGFPIITKSVEKRNDSIKESIRKAEEAEARIRNLADEQESLLLKTQKEQRAIIQEAVTMKEQIIAEAHEKAREEAERIMERAESEINIEKEKALRDIRKNVALLSIKVSEKVLRQKFEDDEDAQLQYLRKVVDELAAPSKSKKS